MRTKLFNALKVSTLALLLSFGLSFVYAWTAPTVTAPNGNVAAPINTSATAQTKNGALNIATSAISSDTSLGSFGAPGSTAGVGYTSFGNGFVGWDYANNGIALNAHAAGGSVGGLFVQRVDNGHSNVGIGTVTPDAKLRVAGGDIKLDAGHTISAPGRMHIQADNENLYLQPWTGATYVGGGGGAGNLNVIGTMQAGNGIDVGNAGGAYTYITMRDDESPNGVKYIHANSNVVGFLSGAGSWLSYWDNAGNQQNTGSITASGDVCTTTGGTTKCLSSAGTPAGTLINMYQCPGLVNLGGGAWGYYGCQNQIQNQPTCFEVEYPTSRLFDCAYVGKMRLEP